MSTLPTLPSLNITDPQSLISSSSPHTIATQWLASFSTTLSSTPINVNKLTTLLRPDAWWRDILSLTWSIRTFQSLPTIQTFLLDRLSSGKVSIENLEIISESEQAPTLSKPFEDIIWIQFFFRFGIRDVGDGMGIIRLVPFSPLPNSPNNSEPTRIEWQAHSILTTLTTLNSTIDKIHPPPNPFLFPTPPSPKSLTWTETRTHQLEFKSHNPEVIIIGAGQAGLGLAARLQKLGVSVLILEKNKNVGDQWLTRYDSLRLHDPIYYDHMPFLPFPTDGTWPTYAPAPKFAQWLKSYAETMDLNVWTGVEVKQVAKVEEGWEVKVRKEGGEERVMKSRFVVFALGLASGVANMPDDIPGMDEFKGPILHSFNHRGAKEYIGKKVLVVGACTSAHDISQDFYNHNVDVTMYQRSSTYVMSVTNGWSVLFNGTYAPNGPPTHIADLLTASFPNSLTKLIHQRTTKIIADLDKPILDALHKVGFKTNSGVEGSGFSQLAWNRGGGFYFDTGASQLIADRKIKLISGPKLTHFTRDAVVFDDGTEHQCDVVIFATGLGEGRPPITSLLSPPSLRDKLQPIYGLDSEGEINSIWKDTGIDGLWVMLGNLALCRYFSGVVALQIKRGWMAFGMGRGIISDRAGGEWNLIVEKLSTCRQD